MEQTQNRISDERLAEIVGAVCWRRHRDGDRCVICDAIQMARELTALRASHKRLVEALDKTLAFIVSRHEYRCGQWTETDNIIGPARAALAEASKLEGK